MRLIAFALALLIATPAAALDTFSTRSGCLQELRRALAALDWAENFREVEERRFARAPDAGREHADAALAALAMEAQAKIDLANALMRLCETYE